MDAGYLKSLLIPYPSALMQAYEVSTLVNSIRNNAPECEIQEYLTSEDTPLVKFDGEVFRRLVEKVIVHSVVEVTFIFRTGVEVKENIGVTLG